MSRFNTISFENYGYNYKVGDVLTFYNTNLYLTETVRKPQHDCIVTVTEVFRVPTPTTVEVVPPFEIKE